MPQDNNNNILKGIRVANTVAGLPYTAMGQVIRAASTLNSLPYKLVGRGIRRYNDAKLKVSKKLVERRVRNLPATAAISVGAGPLLGPIISNLVLDVLTVRGLSRGQNNTASTNSTNITRKSTNTTPKSNNNNTITINGGLLPEVVVVGLRPKPKSATVNSTRSLAKVNTGNRRGGFSRNLQKVNTGGGYLNKAYTPGVGLTPETIITSPSLEVAIPISLELVSPTPNIPETVKVPQVESVPGVFTRKDVRNILRAKGINPYYEIGGLQRRALRKFLNGEPVNPKYQEFINSVI